MSEAESQRKKIRHAIVAALKGPDAGPRPTTAEDRVFPARTSPAWIEEFPLILVYSPEESAAIFNESPRTYKRSTQFRVEALLQEISSIDDEIDDIAEQIERVLFRDPTFGGMAADAVLVDSDTPVHGDGEKTVGAAILTFEVTYYKEMPSSDQFTDLEDFSKMDVQVDLAPADGAIEAEDSVSIPTS